MGRKDDFFTYLTGGRLDQAPPHFSQKYALFSTFYFLIFSDSLPISHAMVKSTLHLFFTVAIILQSAKSFFLPRYQRPRPSAISSSSSSTSSVVAMPTPLWFQKSITITAPSRGCHLITSQVESAVKVRWRKIVLMYSGLILTFFFAIDQSELAQIDIGMTNLFIQHTSARFVTHECSNVWFLLFATD